MTRPLTPVLTPSRLRVRALSVLLVATAALPALGQAPPGQPAARPAAPPAGTARPTAPATAPPTAPASGRKATSGPVRVGPVVLDPQNVDFGLVGPDTTVSAQVGITNMTDRPLKILQSVPSCQCTTVEMQGTVIEPGSTVQMPMSMKTSKTVGAKVANVQLVFEGHPTPVEVRIACEVVYSIKSTPAFIDVQQAPKDPRGQVGPARPLTGTVRLQSVDGAPFRVLSFHGREPQFKGFDPAKDAPRNAYDLIYDFTGVSPSDVACYQIVETDREDCPVLDIRVRHENTHIRPVFKIADFRSSFGRVAPGEKGSFELEVKELKAARLATAISKDPSQATVRLTGQKPDGTNVLAEFEVVPAPGRTGLLYFPVTLTLSDGRKTDLWVYGTVRAKS